jgi:hypothetical protein
MLDLLARKERREFKALPVLLEQSAPQEVKAYKVT